MLAPGRFRAGRTAWKSPVERRRMQSCSMSYVLTGLRGCDLSSVATCLTRALSVRLLGRRAAV